MDINSLKTESKQGAKSFLKVIFQYSNILGLAGIIVAIVIFNFSEKKRELTLSINSFISLVDKNRLTGSGIRVSFDSVDVDNLYKVNCSVYNSGNSAVTRSDLIESIKISFDSTATLLKYEIEQSPKTIKTNDKIIDNSISLAPDLLNPDDKIDLIIYYTVNKSSALPTTDSRIIEGKILILNRSNEIDKPNKFLINFSSKIERILFWLILVWNILFFILITWSFLCRQVFRPDAFQ